MMVLKISIPRSFRALQEFGLPAILFVNTGFVETGTAYPLARLRLVDRPVTWSMLAEMHESGLVTLGAHTVTHPLLTGQNQEQIEYELGYPLQLFQDRLGFVPRHFAYPGGEWNETVEAAVRRYYITAVVGGGTCVAPADFNPYRIPRVAVRLSDGWFFFRLKARGMMEARRVALEFAQTPCAIRALSRFFSR